MLLFNRPGNYFLLLMNLTLFLFSNQSFGSEVSQIKKIEKYLNGIHSLEADILQIDPYGNKISVIIKLKKPGKLRIEYDTQKADHLILASDGILAIIDYGSNAEPLRYPINETPLKYLSNKELDLLDPSIKCKVSTSGNYIKLKITEVAKSFGLGRIVLEFVAEPISIVGWEIPLNKQQNTKILLHNLMTNHEIQDDLFYVSAELMKFYNRKK